MFHLLGRFNIDTNNGTIFKAGSLDYETKNEYTFIVFAFDSGLTPRTSQAVVRITVTDYNDVGPRFLLTSYTARVTESSLVFESPVQVQVKYLLTYFYLPLIIPVGM